MAGSGSNKPIVFVFGTAKGDTDARKKNLSAINTQVAYRAHERRREKKNRQKAQAKEDAKSADQPLPSDALPTKSTASASTKTGAKLENNVPLPDFVPAQVELRFNNPLPHNVPSSDLGRAAPKILHRIQPINRVSYIADAKRPSYDRHESDAASDSSSDRDVFSTISPGSRRHSTPGTDLTSISPNSVAINSYFEKALDPFFRLPVDADAREQWLVHFYFDQMGHIGFGTHRNSLFCPDRDWVSIYVQKKSLCFQWLLILAEQFYGMITGVPEETRIAERKAKAYRDLTAALAARSVDRDEGISGIQFAAIVDTNATSVHLAAMDKLINDTGGFEAFLDRPLGTVHPEHVATVYAFGRCPIKTQADMERIKAHFLGILKFLYDSAHHELEAKRRIRNRRPWDALSRQVIDSNGMLVPSNQDEHLRYYVKAQQDAFTCDVLAPLLNATLDAQGDFTSQARHMACLMQTALILYEFEDDYLVKAMFLKRLKFVCEQSTAIDPVTRTPCLTHGGLLLINSFVRQEVQTYFDRSKVLLKAVKISKAVVDALKIFGILQQTTRTMLVSWLRGWLVNSDQFAEADFVPLLDSDILTFDIEITDSWLRGMGNG